MTNVTIGHSSFDLSKGALNGILEAIELMMENHVEYGLKLCDTGSGIIPGPMCKGTACSVTLAPCPANTKPAGSFHTHPTLMSFSMKDYMNALDEAMGHPEHKNLMCVSLQNEGLRCKSVVKPKQLGKVFHSWPDTEENRETIKPYFSPRVNVSLKQIQQLLAGVPWEYTTPAEPVIASDETLEKV